MFEEIIKILRDKVSVKRNVKEAIELSKQIGHQKLIAYFGYFKNAPENSIDVVVCNQLMNKFNRNWAFTCAVHNLLITKN